MSFVLANGGIVQQQHQYPLLYIIVCYLASSHVSSAGRFATVLPGMPSDGRMKIRMRKQQKERIHPKRLLGLTPPLEELPGLVR